MKNKRFNFRLFRNSIAIICLFLIISNCTQGISEEEAAQIVAEAATKAVEEVQKTSTTTTSTTTTSTTTTSTTTTTLAIPAQGEISCPTTAQLRTSQKLNISVVNGNSNISNIEIIGLKEFSSELESNYSANQSWSSEIPIVFLGNEELRDVEIKILSENGTELFLNCQINLIPLKSLGMPQFRGGFNGESEYSNDQGVVLFFPGFTPFYTLIELETGWGGVSYFKGRWFELGGDASLTITCDVDSDIVPREEISNYQIKSKCESSYFNSSTQESFSRISKGCYMTPSMTHNEKNHYALLCYAQLTKEMSEKIEGTNVWVPIQIGIKDKYSRWTIGLGKNVRYCKDSRSADLPLLGMDNFCNDEIVPGTEDQVDLSYRLMYFFG